MYRLVADVPSYSRFLPWCATASILGKEVEVEGCEIVLAEMGLAWGPLRYRLRTRNSNHFPDQIRMKLVEGPLRELDGTWRFEPVGSGQCEVRLDLSFVTGSRMMGHLVAPLIGEAMETLTDAFVEEARRRYPEGRHVD
jgi:ribosome-associated toxin RatA of RatAB toxin-antitoxin module